jgi:hypothetical protein
VDLDADPRSGVAVLQESEGGGASRLIAVGEGGRPVEMIGSSAALEAIPLQPQPYPLLGTRSGLAAVTADLREEPARGVAWIPVLLAIAAGVALVVRRHRGKP